MDDRRPGGPAAGEVRVGPEAERPEPGRPPRGGGRILVLGDIEPFDPTTVTAGMQPLASLLASRLAAHGFTGGSARAAPDAPTMGRWMAEGRVDLYFDSAFPASVVREIAGARPLLRRWKSGSPEYHTIVFTRAETGVTSLAGLAGRLVALDDPASTSGYLLPMALLHGAGLETVTVTDADRVVDPPGVACLFTGDDSNVIEWVLAGRAAAGAVDNLTWEAEIPETTRQSLRVLGASESYPRSLLMVRRDLEPELVDELRSILLGLHESDEGRAALDAMLTARFDEFPGNPQATLDAMAELRRLVEPGPA